MKPAPQTPAPPVADTPRESLLRRNLFLVGGYLAVLTLIAIAYS